MDSTWTFTRLVIITGSFGSGKSEYAINLALERAQTNCIANMTLVDLDLVNAYFRVREVRQLLEDRQVQTIVPREDVLHSDLPIPGPGIAALIKNLEMNVIIDVGGDDMGATALRGYRDCILGVDHDLLLVVNPYRPFTHTIEDIHTMKEEIEYRSGLKINGVVSNPNSGISTNIDSLLAKHELVNRAAELMALPMVEILVYRDLFREHQKLFSDFPCRVRPIDIFLTPGWLLKQQKEDGKKQ